MKLITCIATELMISAEELALTLCWVSVDVEQVFGIAKARGCELTTLELLSLRFSCLVLDSNSWRAMMSL